MDRKTINAADAAAGVPAGENQHDITVDDVAKILEENKTPTKDTSDSNSTEDSLALRAIGNLLDHDSNILTFQDLGCLSSCSHTTSTMLDDDGTDGARIWKSLFERAAEAGRNYAAASASAFSSKFAANHTCMSWVGESKLLKCFESPSEAVIAKVGWKKAAVCLLSKSCYSCGAMSGQANPLTMERTCKECYDGDEASWLISKNKAKEAFLLTEKDLKKLRSAGYENETIAGKDCISFLFLMTEVRDASFNKYGGCAEGLAAEFAKRKAAATEKYNKSQCTEKPQKKRSKIEKMSDRPADNLKRLDFALGSSAGLPIGTFVDAQRTKMYHSFGCNKMCGVKGCADDIAMHEKLEHGCVANFRSKNHPVNTPPVVECASIDGLTPLDKFPGATEVLVNLFSTASFEYLKLDGEYDERMLPIENRKVCIITFAESGGVKVCIDYLTVPDHHTSLYNANIEVCFQTVSGKVPTKLLNLGWSGYDEMMPENEVCQQRIAKLMTTLGVSDLGARKFMAILVSRVLSRDEAVEARCDIQDQFYDEPGMKAKEKPLISGVWEILASEY